MKLPLAPTLALVAALAPALARGQGPAPDAPDRGQLLKQAQVHVNEASKLYLAQDYAGALAALKKAEPLAERAQDPSLANIRFNIARCYEQLEQWVDALEAYEAYNKLPDEPHRKERAWSATQALEAKVYAKLSVTCFPAGARLEIRGLTNGAVSCPWQSDAVRPGNYVVEVDNPGYAPRQREIIVVAGQAQNVQVELKAEAPVGGAPVAAVSAPIEPKTPVRVLPWAVIGGGAAAIGVGAAFHALALTDKDEAEDLPPTPERADTVSSFQTNRAVALAGYGVGAAAVIAGVVLLFVGDDAPAPADQGAQVRFQPTLDGFAVVF